MRKPVRATSDRVARWFSLAIVIILAFQISLAGFAAAQNCTTRWNQFLQQNETTCSDGSRSVEKYNPFLKQWDTTITPGWQLQQPGYPSQLPQRCTTKWNPFLRQWEQQCF